MKFGKIEDISQVDFNLPPAHQPQQQWLSAQPQPHSFEAYVGCPMWGKKEWVGKLYPSQTPAREYLYHYARAFNTIEMNTTHYRIPSKENVMRWKSQAPASFRFCPKIPQTISHYGKLQKVEIPTQQFCDAVAHFEESLGACFMQLHASFDPQKIDRLASYLEIWPGEIPLFIEFRNAQWFDSHLLLPAAIDLLRTHHVGTVITDVAGRRDVLHMSFTTSDMMIRFVGNGLVDSDYQRVDSWINQIGEWVKNGLRRLYFFVHEPDDVFAPEMGVYVIEQLNKKLGLAMTVPNLSISSEDQMRLF